MKLILAIFLITAITNGLLFGLVAIKKQKELRDPKYWSFLCGIFFLLLWELFNYVADTTPHYARALICARATIPAAFFMFWFFFVFSTHFPVRTRQHQRATFAYLGLISFFSILAMTNLVMRNVTMEYGIGLSHIDTSWLFAPIMVLYITIFCHGILILFRKYRTSDGIQKGQIRYTLVGWGLFLIGAIIVSGLIPLFFVNSALSKLGPLFSICMIGCTTYAILRHQFMDIRIVVQRSLIYLILFAIAVGVYSTGLGLLARLVHTLTDTDIVLSAGLTMILGISSFRSLERYFKKVTDPVFFKDSYHYADALHRLSKALHTNVSQTDIVAVSSLLLKSIFKTDQVEFLLSDQTLQEPTSAEIALSVPIIFENRQIGILTLGVKKSGDPYTPDDRQLLETFAYQAAISLEKGRLYEKVEEYSLHLEQLVSERTAEIKKLREDDRQAMVDISHNLQTPLAIVKGELETLATTSSHPEKINAVKKSILRISDFIRQLLRLSKLDHSAFDVDLKPANLSALVTDQVEYFEVMAEAEEITMGTFIAPDVMIFGNKRLLEELLTNLVSNSIKYRHENRSSTIRISLLKDQDQARLVVEDNGRGIPAQDLPDIFSRFYRGSRELNTPGTGLGLAICQKIVERHGGSIFVESVEDEQTTVTITFPLPNPNHDVG